MKKCPQAYPPIFFFFFWGGGSESQKIEKFDFFHDFHPPKNCQFHSIIQSNHSIASSTEVLSCMKLGWGGGRLHFFRKFTTHFHLLYPPPVCDFEILEESRTAIFRKCPLILSFSCVLCALWLFLRFSGKFSNPLLIITFENYKGKLSACSKYRKKNYFIMPGCMVKK